VYPILERLELVGWITGQWEPGTPQARPARRLYTITSTGRQTYAAAQARSQPQQTPSAFRRCSWWQGHLRPSRA
jgi:DNA-binding PadR family transcriptional regulator